MYLFILIFEMTPHVTRDLLRAISNEVCVLIWRTVYRLANPTLVLDYPNCTHPTGTVNDPAVTRE